MGTQGSRGAMYENARKAYAAKRSGKYDARREIAFEPLTCDDINVSTRATLQDDYKGTPIVPDGNGLLDTFCIEDIDKIAAHRACHVQRGVRRLVGIAISQHVGNDEAVAPLLEERHK